MEHRALGRFGLTAIETNGLDADGAAALRPPVSLIHYLERYAFPSARDQNVFQADYCVASGSSICSRKLVTVTKNQDNIFI